MKVYTGIGSRNVPTQIYDLFIKLGSVLATRGYVLRSGGASGCDTAFELGCDQAHGLKEIYLPWNKFNNNNSTYVVNDTKAFELASKFHPYWNNLSNGAKKLQARNSHQVLGWNLDSPTNFIICYTDEGKLVGGTAQALRLAEYYRIKVFNAGSYSNLMNLIHDIDLWMINNPC